MDLKNKEICRTLQIILWLWFGLVTSFVSVNVVNIARLETQVKHLNQELYDLQKQYLLLKHQPTLK
jgi:hypothetical protein